MTTLTIKINEKTAAGKAFITMSEVFFKGVKGIDIIENLNDIENLNYLTKQNSAPNATTLKIFKNTDKNIGLNKAISINDLFEKLEM